MKTNYDPNSTSTQRNPNSTQPLLNLNSAASQTQSQSKPQTNHSLNFHLNSTSTLSQYGRDKKQPNLFYALFDVCKKWCEVNNYKPFSVNTPKKYGLKKDSNADLLK